MKKRNKSLNFLKIGILFFGITLLLWNCEKENVILNQNSSNQKTNKLRHITSEEIPEIINLLNNKFHFAKGESGGININYDNILEVVDTLHNETYSFKTHEVFVNKSFINVVITKNKKNISQPLVYKYSPSSEFYNDYINRVKPFEKFNGIIEIYTLENYLQEKKNKSSQNKTSSYGTCNTISIGDDGFNNTGSSFGGSDISCTLVGRLEKCWCNGDLVGVHDHKAKVVVFELSCTRDYMQKITSSNSCGGTSPNGSTTIGINEPNLIICDDIDCKCPTGYVKDANTNKCIEEDKVFNELTGKEKCAYEKMIALNLFKSTIKKFENSSSYNLTLKSWTKNACNNSTNDACTDASDLVNGNITIYIQNPGRGTLDVAAMILHEGIHAEIFKYVDEYKKGIDPTKRKELLDWYFTYKAQNDNTFATSNAQHQHMADKYVKPIAEALRKLDNNKYPLNDYMGFAWEGLRPYGYDGYRDNGKWVKLDKNQYIGNINKILDNTDFNKNCN
ncbi:MAG: hypothetical protein AB8B78_12175 [Polaribacter sp.]